MTAIFAAAVPLPPPATGVAIALLGAAALLLGAPALLGRLPREGRTAAGVAAAASACLLLCAVSARAFDPYALAIFAFTTWGALEALRALGPSEAPEGEGAPRGAASFGATDVAVWLLLWIPFDMRWNYALFPGGEPWAYEWWSVYLSVVAAAGWGRLRALPGFDYRLVPGPRDLLAAVAGVAAIFAIVLPAGLLLGFIQWPGRERTALEMATQAPGIFLTIAIPEELYFRGVLQAGLEGALAERRHGRTIALVAASLLFGLMHWNNVDALEEKLAYLALATVSGLFYGLAYRMGGSILAPALVHTSVDWIWFCFLTKG